MVCDAFVTGLRSNHVRQRLLEQTELTLQKTVDLANSLEVAHQNMEAYAPDYMPYAAAAWMPQVPTPLPQPASDTILAGVSKGPRCYFCGQEKHPRQRCPAKDVNCSGCGKKGHFAKVCRAKSACGPSSATCDLWAPPSWTSSQVSVACGPLAPPT